MQLYITEVQFLEHGFVLHTWLAVNLLIHHLRIEEGLQKETVKASYTAYTNNYCTHCTTLYTQIPATVDVYTCCCSLLYEYAYILHPSTLWNSMLFRVPAPAGQPPRHQHKSAFHSELSHAQAKYKVIITMLQNWKHVQALQNQVLKMLSCKHPQVLKCMLALCCVCVCVWHTCVCTISAENTAALIYHVTVEDLELQKWTQHSIPCAS